MSEPALFDLEAVRKEHIGKEVGSSEGIYPVEYDPIRRFCHMAHDTNPLFLDPEYAKAGPHGEVIVPPTMIRYFSGRGIWPPTESTPVKGGKAFAHGVPTPGDRGINMGIEYEFFAPVRVGDRLRSETRISDIFVRPIRLDPEAVWIVTEALVKNQNDEVVASVKNTVLVHRAPEDQ